MKTKAVVVASLLMLLVTFGGYVVVAADDVTHLQRLMEVPAARRIANLVPDQDMTLPGPVTLLDAEQWEMQSLNTGRAYRIYVAVPPGYSDGGGGPSALPVVYSLDANWHFPIDEYTYRQLVMGGEAKDAIIVGIGYATDEDQVIMGERAQDMLPANDADLFLAFLQEELIPYIDATYRTDPEDRTLAGHSYGGLFTLYTLFTQSDAFQRYIAMSPALWYTGDGDERLIFELEAAYAEANTRLPVDLFLSVGELEPEKRSGLWMVSNLLEFHQVLESREYRGLDMEMMVVDELGHAGCYAPSFTRGFVEVFD